MGKQLYALFLNGKGYGRGDWKYMQELMDDWVNACNMYGDVEVDFKIVKTEPCGKRPDMIILDEGFLSEECNLIEEGDLDV